MERGTAYTRRELLAAGLALGAGAGLSSSLLGVPWRRTAWGRETTLKTGYVKISALIQYFAAKEQGFFKEEGLTLKETSARAGAMLMEGVIAGSIELGYSTTIDIAQVNLKGLKVNILYPGTVVSQQNPYAQLVVPNGSDLKAAKDFEGRTVGVPVARTAIDLSVRQWMAAHGADPAKVKIIELGFPGILPALRAKRVDAVMAIEPMYTIIKGQKLGKALAFTYGALGYRVLAAAFTARQTWVEQHPETAQAIVRALDRSTQWLLKHQTAIPGVMGRNTRIKEGLARRMILPGLTRVARKADVQPFLDLAAKFNYLSRPIDICTVFSKYCPQEC